MLRIGQTITRLRAPLVADPYSGRDSKRDWVNAAEDAVSGYAIDASGSVPKLVGPFGADVQPGDRFRTKTGKVYEVDGDGTDVESPFTRREFGSVWDLVRVEV